MNICIFINKKFFNTLDKKKKTISIGEKVFFMDNNIDNIDGDNNTNSFNNRKDTQDMITTNRLSYNAVDDQDGSQDDNSSNDFIIDINKIIDLTKDFLSIKVDNNEQFKNNKELNELIESLSNTENNSVNTMEEINRKLETFKNIMNILTKDLGFLNKKNKRQIGDILSTIFRVDKHLATVTASAGAVASFLVLFIPMIIELTISRGSSNKITQFITFLLEPIPNIIYKLYNPSMNDYMKRKIIQNDILKMLKDNKLINIQTENHILNNFIKDFTGKLLMEYNKNEVLVYGNNKKDIIYKNTNKNGKSVFYDENIGKIILKSLQCSMENLLEKTKIEMGVEDKKSDIVEVKKLKTRDDIVTDWEKLLEGTAYFIHKHNNKIKIYNRYDKHSICDIGNLLSLKTGGKNNNRNSCNQQYNYNHFSEAELLERIIKLGNNVRREKKTAEYFERIKSNYGFRDLDDMRRNEFYYNSKGIGYYCDNEGHLIPFGKLENNNKTLKLYDGIDIGFFYNSFVEKEIDLTRSNQSLQNIQNEWKKRFIKQQNRENNLLCSLNVLKQGAIVVSQAQQKNNIVSNDSIIEIRKKVKTKDNSRRNIQIDNNKQQKITTKTKNKINQIVVNNNDISKDNVIIYKQQNIKLSSRSINNKDNNSCDLAEPQILTIKKKTKKGNKSKMFNNINTLKDRNDNNESIKSIVEDNKNKSNNNIINIYRRQNSQLSKLENDIDNSSSIHIDDSSIKSSNKNTNIIGFSNA